MKAYPLKMQQCGGVQNEPESSGSIKLGGNYNVLNGLPANVGVKEIIRVFHGPGDNPRPRTSRNWPKKKKRMIRFRERNEEMYLSPRKSSRQDTA